MIGKYSKEDLLMWKEWLIYGTALGVAEKVKEALAKLKIELPEVKNLDSFKVKFTSSFSSLDTAISEAQSPSSSTGFGSGGGFGGGGAGGR